MTPFSKPYDFLLVGHCNCSSVLYRFRDKARYWSKIAIFHTPLAFDAPVGGGRVAVGLLAYRLVWKNENGVAT